MNKCLIDDDDCPYFHGGICDIPKNEGCSHAIWVDESVQNSEGIIQLPVGTGKSIGGISIVAGGGRSAILEAQSIGRSQRVKAPILRSFAQEGGIWEVFSDNLTNCGLKFEDAAMASLVYFLDPSVNQPVFILKNRFGPTRYMGMEYLNEAISKGKDRLLYMFLGRSWDEIPRPQEVKK